MNGNGSRWTAATAATLLVTLALVSAGCGGDARESGASTESRPSASLAGASAARDDLLAFARCMRENGVDMPDPKPGPAGQGFVQVGGEGVTPQVMEAANRACEHLLPKAPELDQKQIEQMTESALRFARCMREHGVDMPDPKLDGKGGMSIQIGGVGGDAVDPLSPAWQEAQKACAEDGENGFLIGPAARIG